LGALPGQQVLARWSLKPLMQIYNLAAHDPTTTARF
jgi:hypothetical protein